MPTLKQRAIAAGLVLSGADGPPQALLDRLRRFGLGERMIKSAIAAGAAWQLALLIHNNPPPTLAPLTALFTIQITVAQSIGGAIQRLLGVVLGILVAFAMQATPGANAFTIAAIVLLTIGGGRALGLDPSGVEQLAVSGLLVLIAGAVTGNRTYWQFHVLDTVVGSAVGVALNWLIAPPNHVDAARMSVQALGARLVDVLDDLAAGFATEMNVKHADECLARARAIAADLTKTQAALRRADESLRYNLPGRRQHAALVRYLQASRALEHCAVQTRVMSRTVLDATNAANEGRLLQRRAVGEALAELFSAIARYLEFFLASLDGRETTSAAGLLRDDVCERRALAERSVLADPAMLRSGFWVLLGELLSISDQLIADLSAISDLLPTANGSFANHESVENDGHDPFEQMRRMRRTDHADH